MAEVTILYWRDIPAQVVVKAGRKTAKQVLSERFETAIDRAAMKAKLRDTDSYLAHWRKGAPEACADDLESVAAETAARLEQNYDEARLARLVANGGGEDDAA